MMDYSQLIPERVRALKPSGIRKFFDIAATMDDVLSLSIGEPDFVTPWVVRDAGIDSLVRGRTFYTSNAGLIELRTAICEYYARTCALSYTPEQALVTVGGSEAIDLCLRTLLGPGDEVIIPEPSFVCYEPITQLCGGRPVAIRTKAENEFRLTADELRAAITPRTKILVLPYPNNPTGAVMEREDLEAIADVLRGTNIIVLSDELYAVLTYTGRRHVSIANIEGMQERTIVVNGFSKAYAMTGWRLGYALGPKDIIKTMTKIHQFAIMSAPTMAQDAAVVALQPETDGAVQEMVEEYNMRRRLLLSRFRGMGIECFEPLGAFYVFPSIAKFGLPSEEFCERFLYDEHVAIVPGSAFGASGEGFARISYAKSLRDIETAMDRMERFIAKIQIER